MGYKIWKNKNETVTYDSNKIKVHGLNPFTFHNLDRFSSRVISLFDSKLGDRLINWSKNDKEFRKRLWIYQEERRFAFSKIKKIL